MKADPLHTAARQLEQESFNYMNKLFSLTHPRIPSRIKIKSSSGRKCITGYSQEFGEQLPIRDGFDLRLMVLVFDAVCAITKSVTFENAVLTVEILRNMPEC